MRFRKSLKNLIAGWAGQFFIIIMNLISKRVFVNVLGEEYLGIGGLFSNLLSVLSLAELGISACINYSLYKPLAEKNKEEIKSIMYFYKRVYKVIGLCILAVGIFIIPVLKYLVPEIVNYQYIYVYYILFLLNTAATYFYSYKGTLVIADQKRYIQILNHYGFSVCLIIIQVFSLLITRNYILYLLLQALFSIAENMLLSYLVDKRYPFLRERKIKQMEKNILYEIKRNTIALMFHKIGNVLVTATDNIVVSRCLSLAVAGTYSSYMYVVNSVGQVFQQLFSAIQASIGNMGVKAEEEIQERIYFNVFFAGYVLFSLGTVCFSACLAPFVKVWMGERFGLEDSIIFFIVISFYINGLRHVNLVFLHGYGLFWKMRWNTFLEGILNLCLSLLLVKDMGLSGVVLGTIISSVVSGWIIEPYILCTYIIHIRYVLYWIVYMKFFLSTIFMSGISYIIIGFLGFLSGWKALLIRLVISLFIYIIGLWLFWRKDKNYLELKERFIDLLKGIKKRTGRM